MLAPIVLFTYNRPNHTKTTLECLFNNLLASESTLYIYSDGPKLITDKENCKNIETVRSIIREKQWCKTVHFIESAENKGLATSIIVGVTEIINIYGKVIVLEDDLITSKYFLTYMNNALNKYAEEPKVMQVSGFSFPVSKIKNNNSAFFLNLTTTWGWATWKRAWEEIDFECNDYSKLKTNKNLSYNFNLQNRYNYSKMFLQQMESQKVSSWGIRFWWNVFKKEGLVLYPDRSLIKNIGWDGSGRHGDNYDLFPLKSLDDTYEVLLLPNEIEIHKSTQDIIFNYIKSRTSLVAKIILSLKRFI